MYGAAAHGCATALAACAAVVGLGLGGCGEGRSLDVCPLTPMLESALREGRVEVRNADAPGMMIEVDGFDGSGRLIASGSASIAAQDPCVCLSPDGACQGLSCHWDGAVCSFHLRVPDGGLVPDGGVDATVHSVTFGENATDQVHGVTTDTYISDATSSSPPHGADLVMNVDTMPAAVGLLRFELRSIPVTATVTAARLTLKIPIKTLDPEGAMNTGTNDPVSIVRVLESWDEATATWTSRGTTEDKMQGNWMSAGCGAGSCATTISFKIPPPLVDYTPYAWNLPADLVQDWVSHPETNFGMAFKLDTTGSGDNAVFRTREADPQYGELPRLEVQYSE